MSFAAPALRSRLPSPARAAAALALGGALVVAVVCEDKLGWALVFAAFGGLAFAVTSAAAGWERAAAGMVAVIGFTVPLPFVVRAGGKDAATLTTLLILAAAALVAAGLALRSGPLGRPAFLWWLPAAILAGQTVSMLLHPAPWDSSLRNYLSGACGVLLYYVVLAAIRTEAELTAVLGAVLAGIMAEVGVTFVQLRFPGAGARITTFFGGSLQAYLAPGEMKMVRVGGVSGSYELMAEMFCLGGILALALLYQKRRLAFAVPLMGAMAGLIFNKTRSSLVLLIVAFLVSVALVRLLGRDDRRLGLKTLLLGILGAALIVALFPGELAVLRLRFADYFNSSNLLSAEAIHRQSVWGQAAETLQRPTLLGNGIFDRVAASATAQQFHSLYFTLLYRTGLVGLALHAVFWAGLLALAARRLFRRGRPSRSWHLGFFFAIALVLLLVDETKIEYLRNAHSLQFAWLIYAGVAWFVLRGDAAAVPEAAAGDSPAGPSPAPERRAAP